MIENIQSYCKIGIVHPMIFPATAKGEGPIYDTIKRIACDEYFDGIEITRILNPQERARVVRLLHTSKLTPFFAGQPALLTQGQNINDLDENKRLQAIQTIKDAIDMAKEIGSKGVGYLSGKYEESTKEQSYQALIKSTKELCDYAQGKDIMLVLEIFDYDIDKKSLIGPTKLAKKLADEITKNHKNFGLMVDLSHIPMYYESIAEAVEPIKEYIVHAHIGNTVIKNADCVGYGDHHQYFGFPNGENDVPQVKEFLEALLKIGYLNKQTRPFLSFEIKPWEDDDPELVIINAKRVLNRAWSMIEGK